MKLWLRHGHRRHGIYGKNGIYDSHASHQSHASHAHDLRRSFGTRQAKRVKPLVLQKLMRHSKLDTTLKYYADIDGDYTSAEVWAANSAHFSVQLPEPVTETVEKQGFGG